MLQPCNRSGTLRTSEHVHIYVRVCVTTEGLPQDQRNLVDISLVSALAQNITVQYRRPLQRIQALSPKSNDELCKEGG